MPNVVELFAGAGGLGIGLKKAGFTPLMYVDFNKDCINTLNANYQNVDIRHMSVSELHLDHLKGQIDLLAGGPPCQSFSQAGQRKGFDDTRGNMMLEYIRLIRECEPKVFLIENVVGLTTHESGDTFRKIIELLQPMHEIHHKILNATNYGVAQKRKRVFIIGLHRSHSNLHFEFPEPLTTNPTLRDALLNCPISEGMKYPLKKEYMGKSLESGGGKRGIARRIAWDEACLTLTTSPMQKQTERCHPDHTRPFTVREYARIQSFPDTYTFTGSIASQYKQIGNAVPCELAYHMGKAIYKSLS